MRFPKKKKKKTKKATISKAEIHQLSQLWKCVQQFILLIVRSIIKSNIIFSFPIFYVKCSMFSFQCPMCRYIQSTRAFISFFTSILATLYYKIRRWIACMEIGYLLLILNCSNTKNQAISVDKLFDFVLDGFESEGCVIVNQFGHQFNANTVLSINLTKFA